MIVITDVKYFETENKDTLVQHLYSYLPKPMAFTADGKEWEPVTEEIIREAVHGRRYVDEQLGIDVVIGVKNKVATVLGMQYDHFINMSTRISLQQKSIDTLTTTLCNIRKAGVCKRLKYLFTGKIA